jgi:hypothetical protein
MAIASAMIGVAIVAGCTHQVLSDEYEWDSPAGPNGPGHRRSFEAFLGIRLYQHPLPHESNANAVLWTVGLYGLGLGFGALAGYGVARCFTRSKPNAVTEST